MSDWQVSTDDGPAFSEPLIKVLLGETPIQLTLKDNEGRSAWVVKVGDLALSSPGALEWFKGDEGNSDPVLMLLFGDLEKEQIMGAIRAYRKETQKPLRYLAVTRLQQEMLHPDAVAVGEISVGDADIEVYRLPLPEVKGPSDALKSSTYYGISGEIEGPGHLEGRARWFKRRHKDE